MKAKIMLSLLGVVFVGIGIYFVYNVVPEQILTYLDTRQSYIDAGYLTTMNHPSRVYIPSIFLICVGFLLIASSWLNSKRPVF